MVNFATILLHCTLHTDWYITTVLTLTRLVVFVVCYTDGNQRLLCVQLTRHAVKQTRPPLGQLASSATHTQQSELFHDVCCPGKGAIAPKFALKRYLAA